MRSPFRQSPITSWLPGSEVMGETRTGVSMVMCKSQQNVKSENVYWSNIHVIMLSFFSIWSGIHYKFPFNRRWDGFFSCKGGGDSGRRALGSAFCREVAEVAETGAPGLEEYGIGIAPNDEELMLSKDPDQPHCARLCAVSHAWFLQLYVCFSKDATFLSAHKLHESMAWT